MNERIQQLAHEAGLPTYNPQGIPTKLEKFAELIVRECVKFCKHESNDDDLDEYDMGMWAKAESIKTSIKEHFGVEE